MTSFVLNFLGKHSAESSKEHAEKNSESSSHEIKEQSEKETETEKEKKPEHESENGKEIENEIEESVLHRMAKKSSGPDLSAKCQTVRDCTAFAAATRKKRECKE